MLSVSSPEKTQGAAPAPSAVLSRSAPYGIALLRVALGVLLFAHGALKVFVFTLPGTAAFFASAGFPAWSAYLVAPAEVLGGLALMLGFQTRLVALLSLPILLGALSVHLGNGWLFSAPKGGWEFLAFLVVAMFAQTLLGSGAVSLDACRQQAK